jgi:hypothetical protein
MTDTVSGEAGQTDAGHRRLNLVWYDPEQGDLLRGLGLLDDGTVHASLAPEAVPGPVRERLAAFAAANWPSPWREALALAQLMAEPVTPTAIPDALGRYQQLRLGPATQHVTVSEQATAAYLARAWRDRCGAW